MTRKLTLAAPLLLHTGYGQIALAIFRGLVKRGFQIVMKPAQISQQFEPIPDDLLAACSRSDIYPKDRLIINVPQHPAANPQNGKLAYLTMWETTRIFPEAVRHLNTADLVMTPCNWCKETFEDSGVTTPIKVVPLGIDTKAYSKPDFKEVSGPFIVAAAGKLTHGGIRKGLLQAIDVFRAAFPAEAYDDVQLQLKCHPDDDSKALQAAVKNDFRIKLIREHWDLPEFVNWLRSATVFLSLSKSEGWGLIQQQATACGTPVVGPIHSGLSEFLNCRTSFRVKSVREKTTAATYQSMGNWFAADEASAALRLQESYADPEKLIQKSIFGAVHVSKFSEDYMVDRLVEELDKAGFAEE